MMPSVLGAAIVMAGASKPITVTLDCNERPVGGGVSVSACLGKVGDNDQQEFLHLGRQTVGITATDPLLERCA
jgi:hypothetical protein